jgi:DMSO/TMAO reductase YedYZ molybdopterin-dependent catalytic subunit
MVDMMKNMHLKLFSCLIIGLALTACSSGGDKAFVPQASNDIFVGVIVDGAEENEPEETEYALTIKGSGVDSEKSFTIEQMKGLPEAAFKAEFFALNNYGTKEYFEFEGARVNTLLSQAGLNDGAKSVTFVAEDGYENTMTISDALREDYIDEQNTEAKYPVILAWEENGEVYDSADGAPLRLVFGQKEAGDVNKPGWVMNVVEIVVE